MAKKDAPTAPKIVRKAQESLLRLSHEGGRRIAFLREFFSFTSHESSVRLSKGKIPMVEMRLRRHIALILGGVFAGFLNGSSGISIS
ncbi:MAG: hypothetical protein RMJ33_09700 [Saprospiraceae bacterium]|nr:hypothetical protein [Saprospiraceae bacterium]MDW8230098.1 hypothetical protein [Saprospiraceae bacterium]